MVFSTGLIFLALAVSLENIGKIFSVDISGVPSEELKLFQVGLYGFFIALMVITALFGGEY